MSNNSMQGGGGEESQNGHGSSIRRDMQRSSDVTGALPILSLKMNEERNYPGSSDFERLLQSLHALFEHDRQVASQPDAARCGICYLYFPAAELVYREEGFYLCARCEQALGTQQIVMLRKQQKL